METLTKTVERMSEPFAKSSMQEDFATWAERSIAHSDKEKKEKEGKYRPREISLKEVGDMPEDQLDFMRGVVEGYKTEEKEAARRTDQRSSGEKSTAGDSRVALKELTQAEVENHWRQISPRANPAWQKASPQFIQAYTRVLREFPNAKELMEHFAAQPEVLHGAKNVDQLRATVHTTSEVQQSVARHPDAKAKIASATNDIVTKAPLFMQQMVNDSEVLGELLYTLADATTLNNLLQAAKTNPGKAVRVLHDMELEIKKSLSRPQSKAPEVRPRAPKPPSEVGGRGAAGDDGTRGETNFRSFSERQNQQYARAR